MAQVGRSLARRAVAEAVGTAMLLAAVVGSGIMAELVLERDNGPLWLRMRGRTGVKEFIRSELNLAQIKRDDE